MPVLPALDGVIECAGLLLAALEVSGTRTYAELGNAAMNGGAILVDVPPATHTPRRRA